MNLHIHESQHSRRDFLKQSALGAGALGLAGPQAFAASGYEAPPATADAIICIWLPGGVDQIDTWDPKKHTPFEKGMKGSELLSTVPKIPTSADGIFLGQGLEHIAKVMDKGTILRTLTSDTKFGAIHLKAQHYVKTGYEFPAFVQVPSFGSMVARTLGPKNPNVPAYIDIGRDVTTADEEMVFISQYMGPGFLGVKYAPFMIPNPTEGISTLNAVSDMNPERLDRRQDYLRAISGQAPEAVLESNKTQDYMSVMERARNMMDSPVKRAFKLEEEPESVRKTYDVGHRFGLSCLLARRLVEEGARYIEVEYQYAPFAGFDTHENGATRMQAMKQQIDRPIGTLIKELDERGLLERTLVVVMSEFGRTIADQPQAGTEEFGFDESQTGDSLVVDDMRLYGHHGHFSSCQSILFFGGGFKQGYVHGKTADRHPMEPIENPVKLIDTYATLYSALGISPDTYYTVEDRPFFVTKDGKGKVVNDLLA